MTKIQSLKKLNKIDKSISDSQLFLDSDYLNSATYYDYLDRMEKICESIFEWVNLPPSMDPRFLEESLFWFGQASFLKDKEKGLINQIKVVVGSVGYGYKHWDEKFKSEEYINSREKYRKYAMGLLKDVDYVYLTECDSGAEDVQQICLNLKSYLGETVNSEIILDRVEAIKEAITCSNEKDAIFIAGRGNKRTLCDGEETMKFFKDSELTEKGWF